MNIFTKSVFIGMFALIIVVLIMDIVIFKELDSHKERIYSIANDSQSIFTNGEIVEVGLTRLNGWAIRVYSHYSNGNYYTYNWSDDEYLFTRWDHCGKWTNR